MKHCGIQFENHHVYEVSLHIKLDRGKIGLRQEMYFGRSNDIWQNLLRQRIEIQSALND